MGALIDVPLGVPAGLLSFFAVLGVAALLFRLVGSVLRLVLAVAESTAAEGLADVSARRGDLTQLAERREQARSLARRRRSELGRTLFWASLLLVPPSLGWAREVYAAAVLLWLLPRLPLRRRSESPLP